MCGLVGVFGLTDKQAAELAAAQVQVCVQRLAHRGPDARQVQRLENAILGHARLSIIDVEGGSQPMQGGKGWIAYNGEIYNFLELAADLGLTLLTHSDTEVLLMGYQNLGMPVFERLQGMFAVAMVFEDELVLARDPIGIKPLYWARRDGQVWFASELKSLLPVTSQIEEFPAGSAWSSKSGWRTFDPLADVRNLPEAGHYTEEQAKADLRRVLRAAVTKRLIADESVPVGVSLSGGLDSSLIAALAAEVKPSLNTFVVGVPGAPDLDFSFQVAEYLGTRHHAYTYTPKEMLSILETVIYHLESYDAALIRSAIPNYFLARLASQHVKVMLTGEGADELFGGYAYLREFPTPASVHAELVTITGNLHNTNLQRTDRLTMAHGLEARVPFLDEEMMKLVLSFPPDWKLASETRPEKALLRQAFEGILPPAVLDRPKAKFSAGAGSSELLSEYAAERIPLKELETIQALQPQLGIRSREELLYYRIFRAHFGDTLPLELIGRTRSVAQGELAV